MRPTKLFKGPVGDKQIQELQLTAGNQILHLRDRNAQETGCQLPGVCVILGNCSRESLDGGGNPLTDGSSRTKPPKSSQ